ncbi:MAG TPA: hypothetical protein VFX86_02775 [Candidatus Saccharimonadales bacterium]|nr:hypothetical protein [Candidatus Saccharimonadales bacterium]
MDKTNIDFSALGNLTRLDIKPKQAVVYAVLFIITLVWGVTTESTASTLALMSLILFGIVYLIYISYKTAQKNNEVLLAFASQNGFTFEKANKHIVEKGSLYQRGHSKKETRIISGELYSLPMKISDYEYATGHGKNRTDYQIRVMRLTLPRHLPHMVIDCEVESDSNGYSSLPITFDRSQKIELEGDFHKYFNLYVPDKYAVSALSIIAPDAMEALMRMKALCDIEIVENQIYFYWPDTEAKREKYENAFATVGEVMSEIGGKLKSGDIFAHETQAQLHVGDAKNPIKLKKSSILSWLKSKNAIGLYGVIAMVGLLTFMDSSNAETFGNQAAFFLLISLAVIVILTLYTIYSYANKHRLKRELKRRHHT